MSAKPWPLMVAGAGCEPATCGFWTGAYCDVTLRSPHENGRIKSPGERPCSASSWARDTAGLPGSCGPFT